MTSTFDDIKSSWDRDEEGGCAEYNQYPIPYLVRIPPYRDRPFRLNVTVCSG